MANPDDCKEGDYVLKVDSPTTWMATAPCYGDLMDSPVGFGETQQEAIDDLTAQPEFKAFLRRSGRRAPKLEDFTIEQPLNGRATDVLPRRL